MMLSKILNFFAHVDDDRLLPVPDQDGFRLGSKWWHGPGYGNYWDVVARKNGHGYKLKVDCSSNVVSSIYDADTGLLPIDWSDAQLADRPEIERQAQRMAREADAKERLRS